MSIIETSIARGRAAIMGAGVKPKSVPAARQTLLAPAPGVAPAERISPRLLSANVQACRDNRILLDTTADKRNPAIAAYRILRTRLLQRARTRNWTAIGVTSPNAGDGKSITTLNLGLSLARERNSDVILLDLDMRAPSMCRYLGVEPPNQLQDYFEQRIPAEDIFFSIGVDRLLLASGTGVAEAASELLATSLFEGLLQYIRQHSTNPIILLDLPPLLHTDDALVVAPRVDAMLLVASEGTTDRAALSKAMDLLSDFPIAGIALNRAIESSQQDRYGYGYAQ